MAIDPRIIDHTNLQLDADDKDIEKLCNEAKEHGFGAVCVRPNFVPVAKNLLKSTSIKVCTTIGFPTGLETTKEKVKEAKIAIKDGADELDMVMNIEALKANDLSYVKEDISSVKEACNGRILKVIIEAGLLSKDQKIKACQLAEEAGADFVKTSTGFAIGMDGEKLGATVEDVKLMKSVVGDRLGIKAAGGIRSAEFAQELIDAGATRLGCSASISIVSE
jgi:deoxyribose-phosphate aldolase